MDCACEDGIPGSDLKVEIGLSCFSTFFNVIESIALSTEPMRAHNDSASCLHRTIAPNRTATSHLLCMKGNTRMNLRKHG